MDEREVKTTELKDTVEMMNSADYKERLKAEYTQLQIRRTKLYEMLHAMSEGKLNFKPLCSIELLSAQLTCMETYAYILEMRAEAEGVEL